MKKAMSLVSLSLLSVLAGAASAEEQTVTLAVEKMHCALCPLTVQKAIEGVRDVLEVDVSFERQEAVVTYEDTVAGLEKIASASTNAGYPAREKDAKDPS